MGRTNFELFELLPGGRTKLIEKWELLNVPERDVEPVGWLRRDVRQLIPVYDTVERADDNRRVGPGDYGARALVQWKDYGRVGVQDRLVSGPLYACRPDSVQEVFGDDFVPNPRYRPAAARVSDDPRRVEEPA